MTNIQNTESGERLSFYKLFSEKNYRIEIPILQRDYAQGRDSNTDIRDTFLDALKNYLQEAKPNRDLDFIYGSLLKDDDRFIPLDGQQRLTTLFLLHWYLAVKENKLENFRNIFSLKDGEKKHKSKFTYETRTSTREFCDALVSAKIDFENAEPSEIIKNQQWYFLSWGNDPTIQGMLIMLDAIHKKFKDERREYYSLLTDTVHPIITFQFLKLEEFGLTDDLYIKMNARGKQLTSFENFKAKFEQQIKQPEYNTKDYFLGSNGFKRKVPLHEYFSHKIDTDWANLFWAYVKEELENLKPKENQEHIIQYDDIVMNLLKTYVINYIAGKTNTDNQVRDLIFTNSSDLSFNQLKNNNCFDINSIPKLICLLDVLENQDQKAKQFISNFYYFDETILDEFLLPKSKTAEYEKRILIHAYFEYLIKWNEESDFLDIDGLKNWMRVIFNLTTNARYDDERSFTNSIKGVNAILEYSNKIHDFLIQNKSITGFDQSQVQEEILKAILIEKSSEWKNLIYTAEHHGYFKGQIGFLLRLCGVSENTNFDWDDAQDIEYRTKFSEYFEKAQIIFDDYGLRNELSTNGDFIWERALLVFGDYLIWESKNKSFLINSDRDISWKRLLKGDKSETPPLLVKSIFDILDSNNIKASLETIIDCFNENDWRKSFIETPELFKYLGTKRYVRPISPHGFVLLKGERMNGDHAELNTYHLYIKYLKNESFLPFSKVSYCEIRGDEYYSPPFVLLNSWKGMPFEIKIEPNEGSLKIYFRNEKGEEIDETIKTKLELKGIGYSGWNILGHSIIKSNALETVDFLKELCNELQSLKNEYNR